ncbi:hypothetical protein KFK09_008983 [Dendrobium nobile]|uniref:Uncharacterized protein n=1 Tax=Dendrobium nobile TaxID=94219 RepID=A0A8T3BM72_DENNO|nr:hypothetical protein KFK09_008983 [Dendrobium nobile]
MQYRIFFFLGIMTVKLEKKNDVIKFPKLFRNSLNLLTTNHYCHSYFSPPRLLDTNSTHSKKHLFLPLLTTFFSLLTMLFSPDSSTCRSFFLLISLLYAPVDLYLNASDLEGCLASFFYQNPWPDDSPEEEWHQVSID